VAVCVLYEMLTAKRAFAGEDVSDTLAAILRGEPEWAALPAEVAPHVRAVLTYCLQKDRRHLGVWNGERHQPPRTRHPVRGWVRIVHRLSGKRREVAGWKRAYSRTPGEARQSKTSGVETKGSRTPQRSRTLGNREHLRRRDRGV